MLISFRKAEHIASISMFTIRITASLSYYSFLKAMEKFKTFFSRFTIVLSWRAIHDTLFSSLLSPIHYAFLIAILSLQTLTQTRTCGLNRPSTLCTWSCHFAFRRLRPFSNSTLPFLFRIENPIIILPVKSVIKYAALNLR